LSRSQAPLRGVSEIRRFFRTSETPVYFVSATAFNLLGIDRWVRGFRFVNYFDSFDGHHPHVFVPGEREARAFTSIEEIVNYLLGHKRVIDWVRERGPGMAAFLMFDEKTEQLAKELDLDVAFPSAALRHRLDSKIETTQLENDAGVPSVPNVLGAREQLRGAPGARRGRRDRVRPRRADAVRGLRADHLLHRDRGRLEAAREERRWRGPQGHEADRSA
jgi:hypothetical protein